MVVVFYEGRPCCQGCTSAHLGGVLVVESAVPWPAAAARASGVSPSAQEAVPPAQVAGWFVCCRPMTPGTMPKDRVRVLEVAVEMLAVKVGEDCSSSCPAIAAVSDVHGQPE